jgi:hypothetical protein
MRARVTTALVVSFWGLAYVGVWVFAATSTADLCGGPNVSITSRVQQAAFRR